MTGTQSWFLVCCLSGAEHTAAREIESSLGFETFCPQYSTMRIVRGARTRITAALFRGYSFARFDRDADDWGEIRSVKGVIDIYKHDCIPVHVPDNDIRTFQNAERAGVFDLTSSAAYFRQGDEVEIEQRGPFMGLIARIKSAKARKRVEILLDTLTMSIDPCYLRKVG